jgi:hypothetical protein
VVAGRRREEQTTAVAAAPSLVAEGHHGARVCVCHGRARPRPRPMYWPFQPTHCCHDADVALQASVQHLLLQLPALRLLRGRAAPGIARDWAFDYRTRRCGGRGSRSMHISRPSAAVSCSGPSRGVASAGGATAGATAASRASLSEVLVDDVVHLCHPSVRLYRGQADSRRLGPGRPSHDPNTGRICFEHPALHSKGGRHTSSSSDGRPLEARPQKPT